MNATYQNLLREIISKHIVDTKQTETTRPHMDERG